jgi:hypothetical protein
LSEDAVKYGANPPCMADTAGHDDGVNLLPQHAVRDRRLLMAYDTVYHAACLAHPLAPDLEGDQRAENHAAQATKNDSLKEELVP